MKYKILQGDGYFALVPYDNQTEQGEELLVFEADSWEYACTVKNRFLGYGAYQPMGKFWYAQTEGPQGPRAWLVLADTQTAAKDTINRAYDPESGHMTALAEVPGFNMQKLLAGEAIALAAGNVQEGPNIL